ncbi:hypothetical protein M422DRAFT_43771 [Sphaerobolus stellatus SS14]|nr:hypothetical protein M422DRAFT_43771 [Sphaerobolus stellatus SS14]
MIRKLFAGELFQRGDTEALLRALPSVVYQVAKTEMCPALETRMDAILLGIGEAVLELVAFVVITWVILPKISETLQLSFNITSLLFKGVVSILAIVVRCFIMAIGVVHKLLCKFSFMPGKIVYEILRLVIATPFKSLQRACMRVIAHPYRHLRTGWRAKDTLTLSNTSEHSLGNVPQEQRDVQDVTNPVLVKDEPSSPEMSIRSLQTKSESMSDSGRSQDSTGNSQTLVNTAASSSTTNIASIYSTVNAPTALLETTRADASLESVHQDERNTHRVNATEETAGHASSADATIPQESHFIDAETQVETVTLQAKTREVQARGVQTEESQAPDALVKEKESVSTSSMPIQTDLSPLTVNSAGSSLTVNTSSSDIKDVKGTESEPRTDKKQSIANVADKHSASSASSLHAAPISQEKASDPSSIITSDAVIAGTNDASAPSRSKDDFASVEESSFPTAEKAKNVVQTTVSSAADEEEDEKFEYIQDAGSSMELELENSVSGNSSAAISRPENPPAPTMPIVQQGQPIPTFEDSFSPRRVATKYDQGVKRQDYQPLKSGYWMYRSQGSAQQVGPSDSMESSVAAAPSTLSITEAIPINVEASSSSELPSAKKYSLGIILTGNIENQSSYFW